MLKSFNIFIFLGLFLITAANNASAAVRFAGTDVDMVNQGHYGMGDVPSSAEGDCEGYHSTCVAPEIGVGIRCEGKFKECTCPPEYNRTCNAPEIGVDAPCQGQYKNCQCPEGWVFCTAPQVGIDNNSCSGKFASCKCPDNWVTCGGSEPGQGPACSLGGVDKYASCGCLASFNKTCVGWGQEGSGTVCNGQYESCTCTPAFQPCVSPKVGVGTPCASDANKYENCKCPSSYVTCYTSPAVGAQECTDSSGTKYTSCRPATTCAEVNPAYQPWSSALATQMCSRIYAASIGQTCYYNCRPGTAQDCIDAGYTKAYDNPWGFPCNPATTDARKLNREGLEYNEGACEYAADYVYCPPEYQSCTYDREQLIDQLTYLHYAEIPYMRYNETQVWGLTIHAITGSKDATIYGMCQTNGYRREDRQDSCDRENMIYEYVYGCSFMPWWPITSCNDYEYQYCYACDDQTGGYFNYPGACLSPGLYGFDV